MSLITAINRASLGFLPVVLALVACTKPNPDYCEKEGPCAPGKQCNVATNTCEVPRDAEDAGAADVAPDVLPHDSATPDAHADVVDALAPDAQDSCTRDDDCPSPDKPMCLRGVCRKCAGPTDCGPTAPVCGPAGRCVECTDTAGCDGTPATPVCVQNKCVACTQMPAGCQPRYADRPVCAPSGSCVGCTDSTKHCTGAKPICGPAMTCLACADDTACATKSAATPACAAGGACVECTDDKHCTSASKPICDTQMQKCVPCTSDAQCTKKLGLDPGVCMAHEDGRCATVAETVFVQSIGGCSMSVGGGGSATMPYCLAQDGITAAAAGGKPLVVMRGPMDRWAYAASGKLTVVGQSGAKVVGAGVGVHVTGGELYLRGLAISVSGATGTGLVAENGAILRMDRCLVENNGAGGISVSNAGFDIVNTIVAGNDPGETSPGSGITFGGVYLSAAPGKPQRFANDTVVGNKAIGLYCAGPYVVKALLANGNLVGDVHACMPTTSSFVDPKFDPARPYHLTASSPCVDMGDPMDFPPDDYDGDARPQMSRSDCGADEYKP